MKFSVTTTSVTLLLFSSLIPDMASGDTRHLRATTRQENKRSEEQLQEYAFWGSRLLSDLDSMVVPGGSSSGSPMASPQAQPSSLGPTVGATPSISPITPSPTGKPTEAPVAPTIPYKIMEIDNSEVIFKDIVNVRSYTTYCRAGEYTSVQIVGEVDNTVYCITNSEGAGIEFGWEEDFPNRAIIKLNTEPQAECLYDFDGIEDSCDAIDGEVIQPLENHCGFAGQSTCHAINRIVNRVEIDENVDIYLGQTASYSTYCKDDGSINLELVDFDGTIDCITKPPGESEINIYNANGEVNVLLGADELDSYACELGSETRVTESYPCNFDGLRNTVHLNDEAYYFGDEFSGNSTNTTLE